MGVINKVICDQCGYNKDFFLGVGMLGGDLDTAKKNFSYEIQKEIDQWITKHGYLKCRLERKLGTCDVCNTLVDYSEATIYGTDENEVTYITKCKQCNSELNPIINNQLSCPTCGHKLTLEVGGHWD